MLALGLYPEVSLADARTRREDASKLVVNNIDPGDKKKSDKIEQEEARTFEQLIVSGMQQIKSGWKNIASEY